VTDPLGALNATRPPEPVTRAKPNHPAAWEPGYELDGDSGTITTDPTLGDPDWDSIFDLWGLDSTKWLIEEGSLRVNAWQMPGPEGELRVHRQFKASIRRRGGSVAAVPVEDSLRAMLEPLPPAEKVHTDTGSSFVVCFADWQVGGHGGADAFVVRFRESLAAVVVAARQARAAGCDHLVILFLGDMVEGVFGQYAAQSFKVSLDLREQVRMVRHAEAAAVAELAPIFDRSTVVAVPGNHGRNGHKVTTTFEDNSDLAAFEVVAELSSASGLADAHRVEFVLPDDKLIALVEASGTYVLAAHGDQQKGPAQQMVDWWTKTGFTRWGDADAAHMLVTGHRHHLRVEEVADFRTFIVCPTLGGESRWFSELGGGTSNPGTLCYRTSGGQWWGLEVL